MFKSFRQYIYISRNSFTLVMGDPFTLILHLAILGIILLFASLPTFTFGNHLRMLRDQSMALTLLGGVCGATLGAAHLISDDIRRGMLPMLMSRPISPATMVLGKWTGLFSGILVIQFSAAMAYMWSQRIINNGEFLDLFYFKIYVGTLLFLLILMALKHYLFPGAIVWLTNLVITGGFTIAFFVANFLKDKETLGALNWNELYGFLYLAIALMVFSAAICLFAVMFDQAFLIIATLILLLAGLFGPYIAEMIPTQLGSASILAIIPDWRNYWITEMLDQDIMIPFSHIISTIIPSILQVAFYLSIAIAVFKQKEINSTY